jgi:hypothetical protein
MSDSDKKTFLFAGLAIVVIVILMKYFKGGAAAPPVILGQAPVNTSAPSPTGFNPYLPQGTASGPSPGGAQPSDTSQWLHFGASLADTLGKVGGQLITTYGGSNDTGGDSSSDAGDWGW